MNELKQLKVCSEFCSLLLSKPLVLLDISELKKVITLCQGAATACCSQKQTAKAIAQKEVYNLIKSLDEEKISRLREELINKEENSGLNIIFDIINKNLII
tara:strand:+ start:188 stop:490 length:303 start_codon:yes stop_codon:yes gene_type:complete